ncbi:Type IV leader peptidase family protein [anaerobic digester metagenome]
MIELSRFILLTMLLIVAVFCDLKNRKIPNRLTVTFMVIGLGFNAIIDFPRGIFIGLTGFLVGFLVFLLPYILKGIGAGDVKLMAAIGSLTSWRIVLIIGLFTALAGGIITVFLLARSGKLIRTIRNSGKLILHYFYKILYRFTPLPTFKMKMDKYELIRTGGRDEYIPYAVAIAIGCAITLLLTPQGLSK